MPLKRKGLNRTSKQGIKQDYEIQKRQHKNQKAIPKTYFNNINIM
jgi:hypothetical protein